MNLFLSYFVMVKDEWPISETVADSRNKWPTSETKNATSETKNATLETKNATSETKNATSETKNATLEAVADLGDKERHLMDKEWR